MRRAEYRGTFGAAPDGRSANHLFNTRHSRQRDGEHHQAFPQSEAVHRRGAGEKLQSSGARQERQLEERHAGARLHYGEIWTVQQVNKPPTMCYKCT